MSDTNQKGWVGVDLDGTLAHYEGWKGGSIGEPIPAMVKKVQNMIETGVHVKIFTARMQSHGSPGVGDATVDVVTPIQDWCEKHIGHRLEVTNVKDFQMIKLYDDRCVQIVPNEGIEVEGKLARRKPSEDIENRFTHHAPNPAQIKQYAEIRELAKELAATLDDLCPDSREKSLALTNLEQSVFWANASIARNGQEVAQ